MVKTLSTCYIIIVVRRQLADNTYYVLNLHSFIMTLVSLSPFFAKIAGDSSLFLSLCILLWCRLKLLLWEYFCPQNWHSNALCVDDKEEGGWLAGG